MSVAGLVLSLFAAGPLPCAVPPELSRSPAGEGCTATTFRGARKVARTITWRDAQDRLLRLDRDQDADGRVDDRTTIIRNERGEALFELSDENGDGGVDRVTSYVWADGHLAERCRMSWPQGRLESRLVRKSSDGVIIEEVDEDGDDVVDERREIAETASSLEIVTIRGADRSELIRSRKGDVITEELRSSECTMKRVFELDSFGLRSLEIYQRSDGALTAREEILRNSSGRVAVRRFFDRRERAPRAEVSTIYGSSGVATETWRERRDGELTVVRTIRYEGSCPAVEPDRLAGDDAP